VGIEHGPDKNSWEIFKDVANFRFTSTIEKRFRPGRNIGVISVADPGVKKAPDPDPQHWV
jgi:hypothetical protein